MSKLKRIFAVMLTLVMALGMTMTTYAEPKKSATITVADAENATLTYVQVIKPDQTTDTGWAFCNIDIAKAYTDAFNKQSNEDQVVIQKMIEDLKNSVTDTNAIGKALSNVGANSNITFVAMGNPQTVTSAGVYAIKAAEDGFTYNNMAAYVGFGEVEGNEYPSLMDTELVAKKVPIGVKKDNNDDNDVVAVGDTVTYTITVSVPFIDPNGTDKTFFVYDNITGAEYSLDDATIMLGNTDITKSYSITPNGDGTGFSINLSQLIDDGNTHAGEEITVKYKAIVTGETIHNKATAGHTSSNEYGSSETNTYTGKITLTKHGEDENVKLAGAGFKVTEGDKKDTLTFKEEKPDTPGIYVYSPTGSVTEVFTDATGTLVVKGLDVGKYHFEETTAPEGYSINAEGADATLGVKEGGQATAIITTETSLKNTKLSALPETGGIGTTIFTIGGCLIMILAAALFFASRRKSQK